MPLVPRIPPLPLLQWLDGAVPHTCILQQPELVVLHGPFLVDLAEARRQPFIVVSPLPWLVLCEYPFEFGQLVIVVSLIFRA